MVSLKRLWETRDDFSFRNVHLSKWNVVFLFAVAVIMGNMRLVSHGDYEPVFDSFTIEVMCYGVGVLVFAFLPHSRILDVGRIGVVLAIAALAAEAVAPAPAQAVLYPICSFADGLCIGIALYAFFFMLNNTERFLNLIIIELYFAVCVFGLWGNEAARLFFSNVLAYALVAFFALALFTMRKDDITKKAPSKKIACGTDEDCCRIGQQTGMGAVFYLYIVFMVVYSLSTFTVYRENYIVHSAYSIGAFAAIVFVVLAQLLISKTAWYVWIVFLIGALASTALLAINGIFDAGVGSLLYGIANSLGHIAIFYIVGSAANLTNCLKFFRVFCIIEFLLSFALDPGVEYLFIGNEESNSLIALILMVAIACVTLAVYPILHRKIFESEWINDISVLDPEKLAHVHDETGEQDRADGLGLTPREKQIFTFMLTEMSVKQIMIKLEISRGTFNFHTANLYRKLGIQSRTELFAKYATRD